MATSEGILSGIQEMFAMLYFLPETKHFLLIANWFFLQDLDGLHVGARPQVFVVYTVSVESNIARCVVLTRLSPFLAGESQVCQQTGLLFAICQLPTAGKVGSLALWD